jgi:predicted CoA-binding protein
MNRRASIDEFLGQKRIAFAGVSRSERHFSRALMREFLRRGYDVVPVNPQAESIEGRAAFANVSAVEPAVDTVLVITAAGQAEAVMADCARAGVKRVWLYRAAGPGSVSPQAVALGKAQGIDVIAGECPNMFFGDAAWFHRLHGLIKKIGGAYPV